MRTSIATALITGIRYKTWDGWTFQGMYNTQAPDAAVTLLVGFNARLSQSEYAPDYEKQIYNRLEFPVFIADIDYPEDLDHYDEEFSDDEAARRRAARKTGECELYRRIFAIVMRIECHESREFFKVDDKELFHPHTPVGMVAYGDPAGDLTYAKA